MMQIQEIHQEIKREFGGKAGKRWLKQRKQGGKDCFVQVSKELSQKNIQPPEFSTDPNAGCKFGVNQIKYRSVI